MPGILANSASATMTSGDTLADQSRSGYVTREQVTLSVTPTGTAYLWGQSVPAGSAQARSALSSVTAASPVFTPDQPGVYVLTCVVDGSTSYMLRVLVAETSKLLPISAVWLTSVADSQVPTPSLGAVMYYSSTQSKLAMKLSNGTVVTVDTTAV